MRFLVQQTLPHERRDPERSPPVYDHKNNVEKITFDPSSFGVTTLEVFVFPHSLLRDALNPVTRVRLSKTSRWR